MGDLESCKICHLPVLELEGQFELLQPYYVEPGNPALELVGEIHTSCFASSPLRSEWVSLQIQHFSEVRGYEIVSEADGWTVLVHRRLRELLAFHVDGASIDAPRANARVTPYPGGGCLAAECDYHLTLEDRKFIAELQHDLTKTRQVPLAKIVDKLGIRDKLQWPAVLDSGEYVFTRQLQRDWSPTSVSARMRYKRFLPEVVLAVWKTL